MRLHESHLWNFFGGPYKAFEVVHFHRMHSFSILKMLTRLEGMLFLCIAVGIVQIFELIVNLHVFYKLLFLDTLIDFRSVHFALVQLMRLVSNRHTNFYNLLGLSERSGALLKMSSLH
jgi:hypothetical protein